MIYLDTHVVIWLFSGLINKLSNKAKLLINNNELYISPMVRLELQYLYEIQKIAVEGDLILKDLSNRIGLGVCNKNFNLIIDKSIGIQWTRDPFDRLITAHAMVDENVLVTKDNNILANYILAQWE